MKSVLMVLAPLAASLLFSLCAMRAEAADELSVEIEGRGVLGPGYALFAKPGDDLAIRLRGGGLSRQWPLSGAPRDGAPGKSVEIRAESAIRVDYTGGRLAAFMDDGVVWKAPDAPGWQTIRFERSAKYWLMQGQPDRTDPEERQESGSAIELMVGVLHPFQGETQTSIDGYEIGEYPNPQSPNASPFAAARPHLYRPPEWLIEVTTQTAQLKVSPSFRLGEFAPADEGGRHFIALDPRLVQFLEALRVAVQAESDKERPIRILRAYISPAQRKRLEKAGVIYAEFSRYQYGDAAAIVADGDGDGRIDDLDGDGAITSRDADWLADLCAETQSKLQMFGGIGVARSRKDPALPDTPYVDIDLRGVQQRW